MNIKLQHCLQSREYLLWTAEPGDAVVAGPERHRIPLPEIPLPIHRQDLGEGRPSDDAVGKGLYDFLRQFPDAPHARVFAELLRDAFPHYLADLGAQIVMLEHKEVDAPYIRRKIAGLKILALLDPENPGLLEKLGIAFFDLGTTFSELKGCRPLLLQAMGYLQRTLRISAGNPIGLNTLGQIDFLLGDYPAAERNWSAVLDLVAEESVREALAARIDRIRRGEVPELPLLDDLEAVGEAMALYGGGDFPQATEIMEMLEEKDTLFAEFPSPEFFHFLGMCRWKSGDAGGAFAAMEKALELDPGYLPALESREAFLEGRSI